MADFRWQRCARTFEWFVYRNPMYLLSAACMAAGSWMLLESRSGRAGDLARIILTLGVLELYEALVATILIVLHRSRRSPEDEPSLLLVAALFWTGPLAAIAEMTARSRELSWPFAVVACLIALTEMAIVRRQLGLKLSVWTQSAASACIVLLAAAPTLLKIPADISGTNELFLYLCWWVLAVVALLGIGAVRRQSNSRPNTHPHAVCVSELVFFCILLSASAVQFYAMNYAFFGHARAFYASPLLISLVTVAFAALSPGSASAFIRTMAAGLPAVAIVLALSRFDPRFPLRLLPFWLRDPAVPVLLAAAAAWWYGYARRHGTILMHAGNAALGWAVLRIIHLVPATPGSVAVPLHGPEPLRSWLVIALYIITAYLLLIAALRRSRFELIAALMVHQVAVVTWIWGHTPADVLLILLALGWHWLIAMHILTRRPPIGALLGPFIVLVVVSWVYDFGPETVSIARLSAAALLTVLLAADLVGAGTHYRWIGLSAGGADAVFYTARWISQQPRPAEAAIVIGAFALLAAGVIISWHKRSLLRLTQTAESDVTIDSEPA